MKRDERMSNLTVVTGAPWEGVKYFCTGRTGGVSQAPWDALNLGAHVGDDASAVEENRRRVRQGLPADPLWLAQVHGTIVHDADVRGARAPAGREPCADAAITTRRGVPLAIMTADCLPVVMADAQGTVLGVAHAGWRGLAAGVLERTLQQMRARVDPTPRWRAWIGPGIGPTAFEVGADVRDAFLVQHPDWAAYFIPHRDAEHWLADLAGLARARLHDAGVADVEQCGECTYRQADRYFSYRRAARTGRQATFAWLV